MSRRITCGACLAVLALVGASSARAAGTCGSGGATGKTSFSFEGKTVYVYAPAGADPAKPLPLVLALHGDEGVAYTYTLKIWRPFWEARQDFILLAPSWNGSWWRDYDTAKPWMESRIRPTRHASIETPRRARTRRWLADPGRGRHDDGRRGPGALTGPILC